VRHVRGTPLWETIKTEPCFHRESKRKKPLLRHCKRKKNLNKVGFSDRIKKGALLISEKEKGYAGRIFVVVPFGKEGKTRRRKLERNFTEMIGVRLW